MGRDLWGAGNEDTVDSTVSFRDREGLLAMTEILKVGNSRPRLGKAEGCISLSGTLVGGADCNLPEFFFLKGKGRSVPEEGQVLGELDDLLHHESVDVCKVHEQRQSWGEGGQGLVVDEEMSWRL